MTDDMPPEQMEELLRLQKLLKLADKESGVDLSGESNIHNLKELEEKVSLFLGTTIK